MSESSDAPPQKLGLAERATGSLVWAGGSTAANLLVQVALIVVLARLLTPGDYGVVAAALVAIELGKACARDAVMQPLVQQAELRRDQLGAGLLLTLVAGAALALLLYAAAPGIASLYGIPEVSPALRVLAAVIPMTALGTVPELLLQRALRFRPIAVADFSSMVLGYAAVSLSLAALDFGFWSLVGGHVAQVALRTSILVVAAGFGGPAAATVARIRSLVATGGAVLGTKLADVASIQIDNMIVARMLGAASLGAYSRAFRLVREPTNVLQGTVGAVLFSGLSRADQNPEKRTSGYLRALSLTAALYLPLGAICIVLADEIILLVLGQQWARAADPLAILMLGLFLRAGYMVHATAVRAAGRFYSNAAMSLVNAALVGACAALGAPHGLVGVCVGIAIAALLRYLLLAGLAAGLTRTRPLELARAHVLGAAAFALAYLASLCAAHVARGAGLPPAAVVAASGAAGLAAPAACVLALWKTRVASDVRWLYRRIRDSRR